MASPPVRIQAPDAQHYIELSSHDSGFLSQLSGSDYVAARFDELLIVSGARRIHWRFDVAAPATATDPAAAISSVASASGFFDSNQLQLTKGASWLNIEFHVASPLSPRQRGIWVRLFIKVDFHGNLNLVQDAAFRSCGTYVADKSLRNAPRWLNDTSDRWVVDEVERPSRGNPLLCADVASVDGRANLLHIDQGQRAKQPSDYSLAFVLEPRSDANSFDVVTELVAGSAFVPRMPLSGYALRSDFGARARTPLFASGLRLRTWPVGVDTWTLRALDVDGSTATLPGGQWSLESLTRTLFETQALGLATTRSLNRLSLIPTTLRTSLVASKVELIFTLAVDSNLQILDCSLTRISLGRPGTAPVGVVMKCGGATDIAGNAMSLAVVAQDSVDGSDELALVRWRLTAPPAPASGTPPQPMVALGVRDLLKKVHRLQV